MGEPLEWKPVNQFGIGKITQQIDTLTKQIVVKQVEDIGSKLKMLETMGVVNKQGSEQLKKIFNEIEKLKAHP
jgi:hypothetical protein